MKPFLTLSLRGADGFYGLSHLLLYCKSSLRPNDIWLPINKLSIYLHLFALQHRNIFCFQAEYFQEEPQQNGLLFR